MKYKGQGRKNYLVIQFSDYLNDWEVISQPVTTNCAIRHILDKPEVKRDFVRIEMWNKGYRPGCPSKGYQVRMPSTESA